MAAAATTRWRVLRGTFFMVNGANLSCACERSPNGFSRFGHIGDGRLDLVLVRHTAMLNNLRLLHKLASGGRQHIVSGYIALSVFFYFFVYLYISLYISLYIKVGLAVR